MVDVPVADGRVRQLRGLDGFRRLLAVRLTSQLGDGLFAAGLTWLVLLSPERRQSPGEVAVAAAVLLLPFSLVGPFTGVFLDRWSRRQVLAWGQPVRIALVLGLVAAGDRISLVVVYALAIGSLGVNRFLLAALSAGLPHVVPRPLLLTANAVAPTAGTGAVIVGLGLGGGLLAIFGDEDGGAGSAAALLAAALAFGAAGLLAGRRLERHQLGPDHEPDRPGWTHELAVVVIGLRDGLRHLAQRPAAGRALVMISSHRFWFGLWTVQVAMLALHAHGDRDLRAAALVAGASAAGFLVAAVVTPPGRRRLGRHQLGPDHEPDRPGWTHELAVVVTGLRQGLRHLARRPAAGRALVMITSHRFWFGLWTVQVAMLALHHNGDRDLGAAALVAGASAAGFLVAAIVTPPGRRRLGDRGWITLLLAGSALAIAVGTPIAEVPALMIAGLVCGIGAQGVKICVDTAVQQHVDDDYLGRAFAIYDVAFNVVFVGAAALATLLVPTSGDSLSATILAAAGLAATAVWYRVVCDDGATSTASIDG